jgi:3-oxoacyl-[acyl-carrier protein] reductase
MNILIAGGSSGIGLDYLRNHCQGYDSVHVIGRRESVDLGDLKGNFVYHSLDLAVEADVMNFINDLSVTFDKVLFSAGSLSNNPLRVFDSTKWIRDISLNLISVGLLLGNLHRAKKIRDKANIVVISSINGTVRGSKGCLGYASAKAGLLGFVKVFANEVGKKGIKINSISPGMVNTPLVAELDHISSHQLDADRKRYPLEERYAEPQDVCSLIRFLLEENTYVTGQNIVVDGGHSIAG